MVYHPAPSTKFCWGLVPVHLPVLDDRKNIHVKPINLGPSNKKDDQTSRHLTFFFHKTNHDSMDGHRTPIPSTGDSIKGTTATLNGSDFSSNYTQVLLHCPICMRSWNSQGFNVLTSNPKKESTSCLAWGNPTKLPVPFLSSSLILPKKIGSKQKMGSFNDSWINAMKNP